MRTLTLELHKPDDRMPEEEELIQLRPEWSDKLVPGYYKQQLWWMFDTEWGDFMFCEDIDIAEWAYMP